MRLRAAHDTLQGGDAVRAKASGIFAFGDIGAFQRMRNMTSADCFRKHLTLSDRECILLVLSERVCGTQGRVESCKHSMGISTCTDFLSFCWALWEVCWDCCKCFNIVSNICLLVAKRMTPRISLITTTIAISVQVFFAAVLTIIVRHGWSQRVM